VYALQVIEKIPRTFQSVRPAYEDVMYQNQKWGYWNALLSTLSVKFSMKKLVATEGSGESVATLLVLLRIGC
jgi:hypothetical protein